MPVEIVGKAMLASPPMVAWPKELIYALRRSSFASRLSAPFALFHVGPTAWIMCLALVIEYASVNLASPTRQPFGYFDLISAANSGPAFLWICPSTPPPPLRVAFAALTMAWEFMVRRLPCMTSTTTGMPSRSLIVVVLSTVPSARAAGSLGLQTDLGGILISSSRK